MEERRSDDKLAVRGTAHKPDPRREGEDVHILITAERPPEKVPVPPQDAPPELNNFNISMHPPRGILTNAGRGT